MENKLIINNRFDFRKWLFINATKEQECWLGVKRGKPVDDNIFYYLDAVEEALCFGWIDSIWKNIDGVMWSKFTPRKKNSPWTELNKERVRRLEKLGLMTDAGRKVLPPMGPRSFKINLDVEKALKEAKIYSIFKSFPPLYQRVRTYNVAFYKKINIVQYQKALNHLIEQTKKRNMFGEWNDYGRLLNY